jgi:hypothetical protein
LSEIIPPLLCALIHYRRLQQESVEVSNHNERIKEEEVDAKEEQCGYVEVLNHVPIDIHDHRFYNIPNAIFYKITFQCIHIRYTYTEVGEQRFCEVCLLQEHRNWLRWHMDHEDLWTNLWGDFLKSRLSVAAKRIREQVGHDHNMLVKIINNEQKRDRKCSNESMKSSKNITSEEIVDELSTVNVSDNASVAESASLLDVVHNDGTLDDFGIPLVASSSPSQLDAIMLDLTLYDSNFPALLHQRVNCGLPHPFPTNDVTISIPFAMTGLSSVDPQGNKTLGMTLFNFIFFS